MKFDRRRRQDRESAAQEDQRPEMRHQDASRTARRCSRCLAVLLISYLLTCHRLASAQFLFTYEINQEDDSRAPKSSLFDPSAFKIVTPSQLQSSYQKISAQLDSQVASGQVPTTTMESAEPFAGQPPSSQLARPAQPASSPAQPSLLKQTTAALQSFADLFSFGGQANQASQSPSPLAALAPGQLAQPIDRQAEARSLQEHWLAQQQKAHPSGPQSALQSFTTSLPAASLLEGQPAPQPQPQPAPASPAAHQEAPQASYWLTANPLNAPDGNYLVEIKQPSQQEAPTPPSSLVDSLLSVGQRAQSPVPRPQQPAPPRVQPQQPAQSSFLSTPTSYFALPSGAATASGPPQPARDRFSFAPPQHQAGGAVTQPSVGRPALVPSLHLSHSQQQQTAAARRPQEPALESTAQLQPPANAPENFVAPHVGNNHLLGHHHQARSQPRPTPQLKSAEESLHAFRQQQHQQHQQQAALFSAQQQLADQQQQQQHQRPAPVMEEPAQRPSEQPSAAAPHPQLGEIPKVSPQIYESFLLQQRDQHEKHMELLKQQQELNRLLEQKQHKEAAEAKRRQRKKDEAERARKLQEEAAAARKLKAEQEERQRRRDQQLAREEAERKRKAEEARRYRDYLEARERERREEEARKERELAEQRRRAAEIEERELRLKLEREAAERRRLEAERVAAAEAEAKRKRDDEAKLANYLRQQDELKKLLELKQREDEAIQQERRKAAAQQQSPRAGANRATGELRTGAFGTRGRVRVAVVAPSPAPSTPAPAPELASPAGDALSGPLVSVAPSSTLTSEPTPGAEIAATTASSTRPTLARTRSQQVAAAQRRQRGQALDEKLIKQKIPLYSGAGKYGLYRNESLSQDLAALLASVTLPPSSSTTSTTAAPPSAEADSTSSRADPTPSGRRANQNPNEPLFDDDVPRRPARGLVSGSARAASAPVAAQLAPARTPTPPRPDAPTTTPSVPALSRRSGALANETRSRARIGLGSLPADADNDGIPGRAGVEYPVLSSVPATSFSCSKQPLNGYYADTETACQVVHLCQGGAQSSILCPNGTIFNQEKFSCQWWYEVNCSRAPMFYQLNDNLYKAAQLAGARRDRDQEEAAAVAAAAEEEDETRDSKRAAKHKSERAGNLL